MVEKTVIDFVGQTPLVKLNWFSKKVGSNVFAKLEYLNPGLSVKDRMVKYVIEKAEEEGKINPETVLIEASTGNTGAAIAFIAAAKGLKSIIVVPDKVSEEKINSIKAFGAEVIITPTEADPESPNYYPNLTKRLVAQTPNSFFVNQYFNQLNVQAHYYLTGPELWSQLKGKIDLFVAGIGTGGTITGIAKYLKEKNKKIHVLGIDVKGSVYKNFFYKKKLITPRNYKVEGIGEEFVPPIVDFSLIDDIEQLSDKESFLMARKIAKKEGLLLGGSSGAAFIGLKKFLEKKQGFEQIVVLAPDSGIKYLSKIFNDKWMKENFFLSEGK